MHTHSELVQRAVHWLRRSQKCSLVYAEMATQKTSETPDAIGWRWGSSSVVECKTSRADFFKEQRTKIGAMHPHTGMGIQRWYLVPKDLVGVDEVPEWCGLLYVHGRRTIAVKEAPERLVWDSHSEVKMLLSAIRRAELGVSFDKITARWEPAVVRTKKKVLP